MKYLEICISGDFFVERPSRGCQATGAHASKDQPNNDDGARGNSSSITGRLHCGNLSSIIWNLYGLWKYLFSPARPIWAGDWQGVSGLPKRDRWPQATMAGNSLQCITHWGRNYRTEGRYFGLYDLFKSILLKDIFLFYFKLRWRLSINPQLVTFGTDNGLVVTMK